MEKVSVKTYKNSYMLSANGEGYMYFDIPSLVEGFITHVGLKNTIKLLRAEIVELKRTF